MDAAQRNQVDWTALPARVRFWQKVWGLSDWTIEVHAVTKLPKQAGEADDDVARTSWSKIRKYAVCFFRKTANYTGKWVDSAPNDVDTVINHEMGHIIQEDVLDVADGVVNALIERTNWPTKQKENEKKLAAAAFKDILENVVEAYSRAVVAAYKVGCEESRRC